MVERVTFHSESSGFFVIRAKVTGQRDLVTITGSQPSIAEGEYIECSGNWVNDSKYGLQFQTKTVRTIVPTTIEGIEKYLASGMVRGIGPHFAKRLVRAFGETVFDVIEKSPHKLLSLEGIGKKRQQCITHAWTEQKFVREIMVFLQSHGVGSARAVRIYKVYGNNAITKVRENPYLLALDIHGIGFKTADQIAQNLGIEPHSRIRAQAGIRHVLQTLSGEGHCAAEVQDLLQRSRQLLDIPLSVLQEAIAEEIAEERITQHLVDETFWLFLTPLDRSEQGIANHIKRLLKGILPWDKIDVSTLLTEFEQREQMQLSASQREAVKQCLKNKVSVITGGPGVGKTTVVNTILQIIKTQKIRISLCAPTGRAAKRLSESTKQSAVTIHRLLDFDPKQFSFRHNADFPLSTDFLVVDESSMVDVVLMNQLLRALPDHAGLLLVGDTDQLPSVGPGAVLNDMILSEIVPVCHLTEIFRQARDSQIITSAHAINHGKIPRISRKGEQSDFFFIEAGTPEEIQQKLLYVVLQRLPARFGFNPLTDIQVLAPMNKGGLGARSLNILLQEQLNGQSQPKINRFGWTFSPGDKVIQTLNNYDKDVFNGDIGCIESVSRETSELFINFDGRSVEYSFNELDEISLAYAITIHKSQGSEYPCVVIPMAMQYYTLLERNLLYTGVTRGKTLVVLIGQTKAMAMAVKSHRAKRRKTLLRQRLSS